MHFLILTSVLLRSWHVTYASNTTNPESEQRNDRFLEMTISDQDSAYSNNGLEQFGNAQTNNLLTHFLNHREKYGLRFDASQLDRQATRIGYPKRNHIDTKLDFDGLQYPTTLTKKTKKKKNKNKTTKKVNKNKVKNKKIKKKVTKKPLTLNYTKRFQRVKLIQPPKLFNIRNKLVVQATPNKFTNKTNNVKKLKKYKKVLKALKRNMRELRDITSGNETRELSEHDRAGRWLDVYDIVEYETRPFCTTSPRPLRSLIGSCYSERNCKHLGGIAIDHCAYGYGVCCIFKMTCSGFTDQDVSYFESPGYPAPSLSELSCSMAVILKHTTQQLLLEFEFFELMPPVDGNCGVDKFVISGQNTNQPIPVLCGINTGQHLYVDVSDALDKKIFLTVVAMGNEARAFRIKVTQIMEAKAPPDCLQFYEGKSGYIKSFNYDDAAKVVRKRFPSYFNNLNYAICIKRFPNHCTVTYTTEEIGGLARPFELVNTDANGMSTLPAGQAGAEIFNCPDDYIAVNSIRLCGERLNDATITDNFTVNAAVTDFSYGPIILPFRTNEHTVGRGFNLFYAQRSC